MTSEFVVDMVAKAPEATKRMLLALLLDELRDELGVETLGIEHDLLGWWVETEQDTGFGYTLAEALAAVVVEVEA